MEEEEDGGIRSAMAVSYLYIKRYFKSLIKIFIKIWT
jgi:hypothetical protein